MKRIVSYEIEYCNDRCPQFYHNYEDGENCWCVKLNKKIFECDTVYVFGEDFKHRNIPDECPLDRV
jgi:hypothetical protein